jgi:hypothetical protein
LRDVEIDVVLNPEFAPRDSRAINGSEVEVSTIVRFDVEVGREGGRSDEMSSGWTNVSLQGGGIEFT